MKVPLKHIPKINEIINSNVDRVDKECEILALLMNKPLRKIQSFKFWKLNYYRAQIQFLFEKDKVYRLNKYLFIKGIIYKRINEVEYFTTNRLLSIKTYVRGGIEQNITKLAALCYKPLFSDGLDADGNEIDLTYKVQTRMENHFAELDYRKVAGSIFFFCEVSQNLKPVITLHLNNLEKITEELTMD